MRALTLPILTPPNRLEHDGRSVVVGATVFLDLSELIRRDGRVPLPDLCRAVWRTDAVAKRTVWSLCHRITEKLEEAGMPLRAGTDGGAVILC